MELKKIIQFEENNNEIIAYIEENNGRKKIISRILFDVTDCSNDYQDIYQAYVNTIETEPEYQNKGVEKLILEYANDNNIYNYISFYSDEPEGYRPKYFTYNDYEESIKNEICNLYNKNFHYEEDDNIIDI